MSGTTTSRVYLTNRDNLPPINSPIFKVSNGSRKKYSTEELAAKEATEQAAKEAVKQAVKEAVKQAVKEAAELAAKEANAYYMVANLTDPKCPECGPSARVVEDWTRGDTTCTKCGLVLCDRMLSHYEIGN